MAKSKVKKYLKLIEGTKLPVTYGTESLLAQRAYQLEQKIRSSDELKSISYANIPALSVVLACDEFGCCIRPRDLHSKLKMKYIQTGRRITGIPCRTKPGEYLESHIRGLSNVQSNYSKKELKQIYDTSKLLLMYYNELDCCNRPMVTSSPSVLSAVLLYMACILSVPHKCPTQRMIKEATGVTSTTIQSRYIDMAISLRLGEKIPDDQPILEHINSFKSENRLRYLSAIRSREKWE